MTKKLSQATEKTVLAAIQDVVGHVNGGDNPTVAVSKVAKSASLTPNFVKLICSGYNRGATAFQRESGDSTLDKFASFPLADADKVIAEIWPQGIDEKASQALDDEYNRPLALGNIWQSRKTASLRSADLTKLAHAEAPEEKQAQPDFNHAQRQLHGAERLLMRKRSEYTTSQDDLLGRLGQLSDQLKRASAEDLAHVAYAAQRKFGKAGEAVMKYVFSRNKQTPGELNVKQASRVLWDQEPYSLIAGCVKAADDMLTKGEEFQTAKAKSEQRKEALLRPFVRELPVPPPDSIFDERGRKAASYWPPIMAAQAARTAAEGMTGGVEKRRAQIQSLAEDLDDPAHESEFNQIRTQAMLSDLMSNDEVISGYPAEQAFRHYNDLARMSPRAAMQPTLVRGWLRKSLAQGGVEPFESKEMVDVEKTLGDTQNIFGNANVDSQPKLTPAMNLPQGAAS